MMLLMMMIMMILSQQQQAGVGLGPLARPPSLPACLPATAACLAPTVVLLLSPP